MKNQSAISPREFKEQWKKEIRESKKHTSGENFLQRFSNDKIGHLFPDNLPGQFIKNIDRILSVFGDHGALTGRLYDLVKIAGIVHDPKEDWEQSRARVVRKELYNEGTYPLLNNIRFGFWDQFFVINDEGKQLIGCRFTTQDQLEGWFLNFFIHEVEKAKNRILEIGSFFLNQEKYKYWEKEIEKLFKVYDQSGNSPCTEVAHKIFGLIQQDMRDEILQTLPPSIESLEYLAELADVGKDKKPRKTVAPYEIKRRIPL